MSVNELYPYIHHTFSFAFGARIQKRYSQAAAYMSYMTAYRLKGKDTAKFTPYLNSIISDLNQYALDDQYPDF